MKRKGDEAPDEFVLADVERRLSLSRIVTDVASRLASFTDAPNFCGLA